MSGHDPNSTTKIILPDADGPGKKSPRKSAVLVLLTGPSEMIGKQWTLDLKSVTIGRFSTSEILVSEKSISKAHARITAADGVYSISDLGATNGTFVNNKKLTEYSSYQLRHNDQIRTGSVIFKFVEKA